MRYHYEKPAIYSSMYGTTHICNHQLYDKCTLYKINNKGLAVIQQRFDLTTKTTWWDEIDPWLVDSIYIHPKFKKLFDERSGPAEDDIYPTITVRQLMWALKMKPIQKERWETCFDRKII